MEWYYIAIAILFALAVLGWGLWIREKNDSEKWWARRIEEKNDSQSRIASLQTENGKLQTYESFYSQWQHAPALQDTIERLRVEIDDLKSENVLLKDTLSAVEEVQASEAVGEIEEIELDQLPQVVDPEKIHWPWKHTDVDSKRLERATEIAPEKLSTSPELLAEYVSSSTGEVYHTTLSACSCVDFSKNLHKKKPCKHMLSLALCLNIIDENGAATTINTANNGNDNEKTGLSITGKKFAFCGRMKTITQSQAASEVEQHGGKRTAANNADVLIVGDHPPMGKVLAAAKAGAQMISEEDFVEMLKKIKTSPESIGTVKHEV